MLTYREFSCILSFVYTFYIQFQSLQCVPADSRRHRKGCEPWQPTVPQSNPAPNAVRTPFATTISLTGCAQQASVRSSPPSCCSISAGRTCPIFLPRCSCPADYSFSSTLLSGTPAMPMWKRNGKPSCAILTAPLPARRIMTMRFCVSLPACSPMAGLPMATRGISAAQKAETLSPTVLSARICSSPATRCWSVHVRFPLRKWMPIPAPDTPTALCGFLLRIYAVPDWTRSASA